jgi:2-pyrone-4,6-dicarboxylate lactonase
VSIPSHTSLANPGAPMLPGPVAGTRRPAIAFPPLACDCHAHVFGEPDEFPYAPDASYRVPPATLDDYERMLGAIGCARGVLVQPSVYGTDNACMLDALSRRPANLRGVAVVDPGIGDAELEALHAAGVRGIRINVSSETAGLRLEDAPRLAARIRPLGWHLQFFVRVDQAHDLADRLASLPVPCVIDHFGQVAASGGAQSPGARRLLELARLEHIWFKLMGAYRVSSLAPHYRDVRPLARGLIEAAAERCVWATDWPHPNAVPMPDDGDLADCLGDWTSAGDVLQRILVDNPARLYGFGNAA